MSAPECGKDALRARMRALRRALPEAEQACCARAVLERLQGLALYRDARCVMAYAAARGELPLDAVLRDVLSSGRALLLPRCGAPGEMTARRVTALWQLRPGAYGLPEPGEDCPAANTQDIDLILVPGAAFDRRGGRLGQGGGYYDRFLPQTSALRVGVCHDFALLERVPVQAHDARMDAILTPGAWIDCRQEEDRRA
ncbi:MAG: 5-formyltetrahydrofolate cyclo-ligase [Candidatus Ventricola sp.]